MKKLYYLWQFMKGNRVLYIISIASIGMATFLSFFWPMVLRITVDSIIGGKALEAQGWLKPIFTSAYDFMGGRSGLVSKLWICSVLLIFITFLKISTRVDLPQPFFPIRPILLCSYIVKETFSKSTSGCASYRNAILSALIICMRFLHFLGCQKL